MKRRYVWSDEEKALVEVPIEYRQPIESAAVFGDLPAYESPIDGRVVDGRRARRLDLTRSGCRPYEGRDQEQKEANKYKAEQERKLDQLAEKMAHRAWAEAPERIRKVFRSK